MVREEKKSRVKARGLSENEAPRWDDFVARHAQGHLLQAWTWGEFKARWGWRAQRVAIEQDAAILAGAQVLFRRVPFGAIAYVPKGPVCAPRQDAALAPLLAALHAAARAQGAIFLRVEPEWEDASEAARLLERYGWRAGAAVQPRRTLHIDLTRAPDDILAQMKPKWRYNIHLAERKGVIVREGNVRDLDAFYRLSEITARRDRFAIHSRDYYEAAWQLFARRGMATLLVAEVEGQPIAALMAFAFGGKAWYLYGASSDEQRNLMPNHLLQWRAMLWAKTQGCRLYDLWGIPDVEPSTTSLPEGLHRFKAGFGGRVVRYVGAYDYVYRPVLYWLGTKLWPRLRGHAGVWN